MFVAPLHSIENLIVDAKSGEVFEELFELGNGCICWCVAADVLVGLRGFRFAFPADKATPLFCANQHNTSSSMRGELQRVLDSILARDTKFDHIVVETTGLANPVEFDSFFQKYIFSVFCFLCWLFEIVIYIHIFMNFNFK